MQQAGFEFAEAMPEFAKLSEAEVWEAVISGDDSKIACEVTRLVCCFWKKYQECIQKYPNVPPQVLQVSTRCAIERVAVMIMVAYVQIEGKIPPYAMQH